MKILLCTVNLTTQAELEGTWSTAGAEILPRDSDSAPKLIVVDLTANRVLAQIESLQAKYPDIEILAFGPHVDGDAFKQARVAGTTSQVARSKVVERVLRQLQN